VKEIHLRGVMIPLKPFTSLRARKRESERVIERECARPSVLEVLVTSLKVTVTDSVPEIQ
jgi:hypothetical protein